MIPSTLLVLLSLISGVLSEKKLLSHNPIRTPQSEERRWIHYKNGRRDACMHSVHSFSTYQVQDGRILPPVKLHYDFPELNAVVVTATEEEFELLRRQGAIEEFHEDAKRYLMVMPNNKKDRQLQLNEQIIPYGIRMIGADRVWDEGYMGQRVKVCLIDSGLDATHEDFVASHIAGETSPELWSIDTSGHGTHTSGTMGAANNDVGVLGVAPDAEIHMVRVFGDEGDFVHSSDLVSALYACRNAGARIISMSIGGENFNLYEEHILRKLYEQHGILSVAAAGNDGETSYYYPASYDTVLGVGAVDERKVLADFSQRNDEVDLVAPGVGIWSTIPMSGQCKICQDVSPPVSEYVRLSGTSMSCPHVSGVAALLWSANPFLGASQIYDALTLTAEDLGDAGRDNSYGHGLVNEFASLEYLNVASNPDEICEPPCKICQRCSNSTCMEVMTCPCTDCPDGYFCENSQCVLQSMVSTDDGSVPKWNHVLDAVLVIAILLVIFLVMTMCRRARRQNQKTSADMPAVSRPPEQSPSSKSELSLHKATSV
jgi:hypothetical protein